VVGAGPRIKLVAKDIVEHFERREAAMQGKGMIVCMSRQICVDLYNELVALRPEWHSDDDAAGALKIVMTGSASDPLDWQQHVRNKGRRDELAKRFKNPSDPFKLVIVRDMWLTGFDAPCLHTMYVDKPMSGHNLMQAIARVNRVFKDKPGGTVVDYIGLATQLRAAMRNYTDEGGTGEPTIDLAQAIAVMLEKYELCQGLIHGFDWSLWLTGKKSERMSLIPAAQEHILQQNDGRKRWMNAVSALSQAFALAGTSDEAIAIRDDVGFFQAVRVGMIKTTERSGKSDEELEHAIRQIVSDAIAGDEVIDVFTAAGLNKPDISLLSDEFMEEVKSHPYKNVAVELLQRLLNDEIKTRERSNIVQARSFGAMLQQSLLAYENRSIQAAQVIEQLIAIAKQLREAERRGEQLGLTEEEYAFYSALADNESAKEAMGDQSLAVIARELVDSVRQNATLDWTIKETVRAKLRVSVRRILRKYGYPPDLEAAAVATVLEQAETAAKVTAA
jgi:type I restriction enzyme R subunit